MTEDGIEDAFDVSNVCFVVYRSTHYRCYSINQREVEETSPNTVPPEGLVVE